MNGHWTAGVGHVRLRAGVVGGDDWGFDCKCGNYVRGDSGGSVVRLRRPTFVLDRRKREVEGERRRGR